MRILAVIQGHYGERYVEHISKTGPKDWTIETHRTPQSLPIILEDPEDFVPQVLPQVDLVLALTESSRTAQLIPTIAQRAGARAALCPIDDSKWMPTGLKNQLQRELEQMGIESAFPKPFCTLTEEAVGYRRAAEPYTSETISEFAKWFGKPRLSVVVNPDTNTIERVEVFRGAPCGATHFAAESLVGIHVEEAVPKAGLVSHQFPCLAAMDREWIDDRLEDTLMHVSGFLINEEVEEHIKPFKRPPQYFTPDERVEPGEAKLV